MSSFIKKGVMMFIQEVELFKSIPSHVIDEIAQLIVEEDLPKGHLLFRAGDLADYLYIVEEGVNDTKIENSLRFLLDGVFVIETTRKKYLGEFKIEWILGIVDKPTAYYFDVSKKGLGLISKKG